MAIDWEDPDKAGRELQEAENRTNRVLEELDDAVAEYVGPAAGGVRVTQYAPRNTAFEYLSVTLPQVVFNNPRARVKTRQQGSQRAVADALQHGVNRWVRIRRLGEWLLDTVAVDAAFSFGVAVVIDDQQPELGEVIFPDGEVDVPNMPSVYRVSPHDYFEDPMAKSRDEVKFQGHKWTISRDDLLDLADEDDSWDRGTIEDLVEEMGVQEFRRANQRGLAEVKRGEVLCYTVWDREGEIDGHSPEDGYHGVLRFFACVGMAQGGNAQGSKSKFFEIRDPQAYDGPPDGPYQLFGYYTIPDEAFFLGPLLATRPQHKELSAHETAVMLSDRKYKRTYAVAATEVGLAKRLQNADHDELLVINGFKREAIHEIVVGGSTPEMRENMLWAKERLDSVLGIDDAQRGTATGAKLATEVAIADTASRTRLALVQKRFRSSVRSLLRKVMWFLYHDNRVAFALGEPEGEQTWMMPDGTELQEPWFYGGENPEAPAGSFESLELEIEVYSMPRMSEATALRRVADADNLAVNLFPALPMMPWFRADRYLRWRAEQLDSDDYSEWLDMDVLAETVGQEMGSNEESQARLVKPGARPPLVSPTPGGGAGGGVPVGRQSMSPAGPGSAAGAQTGQMLGQQKGAA